HRSGRTRPRRRQRQSRDLASRAALRWAEVSAVPAWGPSAVGGTRRGDRGVGPRYQGPVSYRPVLPSIGEGGGIRALAPERQARRRVLQNVTAAAGVRIFARHWLAHGLPQGGLQG